MSLQNDYLTLSLSDAGEWEIPHTPLTEMCQVWKI